MSSSSVSFETLVTGYGLVEGPRVDDADRLFFSDARKGGVYCRTPDGAIETVVPKRRGVGGIALHADGGLVVSGRNLCRVHEGESQVVFAVDDVPGFNDLFTDAEGRVLVGSQRFDPFVEEPTTVPGELYRVGPGGASEKLYDDVGLTNGIGFSPDGRTLYHSDSAREHVIAHDVAADGALSNRRAFAETPGGAPDGLAVDEEGGVWVAIYGDGSVVRFGPDGSTDRRIPVPARNVASVCFGGADRRDLYVATADNTNDPALRGSIFKARVDVVGMPAPLARV